MSFLKSLERMARGMAARQAEREAPGSRRRSLSMDLFGSDQSAPPAQPDSGGLFAQLSQQTREAGGLRAMLQQKIDDAKDVFEDILGEAEAKIILRAMILAAKADQEITADERAAIMDYLGDDATEDDRAFITAEIEEGPDLDEFLANVPQDADLRRRIFAMSLIAIDVSTPAEEAHIRKLAEGLDLSATDVEMARAQVDGD